MDIVESINRYLAGSPVSKGERKRLTRARDEIVRLRPSQPQPSKPWVGLTTADLDEIDAPIRKRGSATIAEIYHAIEAKLKEKNA